MTQSPLSPTEIVLRDYLGEQTPPLTAAILSDTPRPYDRPMARMDHMPHHWGFQAYHRHPLTPQGSIFVY